MKDPDNIKIIIIYLIFAVILGIGLFIANRNDFIDQAPSMIPHHPDPSQPMYFDFTAEQWRYIYERTTTNAPKEPFIGQRQLDDYLQKKVKGYRKSTFWGEEPGLTDND